MLIRKGYMFRLKPGRKEEGLLKLFSGHCRFIWNKALSLQMGRLKSKVPLMSYQDLTGLLRLWKQSEEYGFLREAHSQAEQQTLKDLDRAIWDCLKGKKKKFPRFKKKGRHDSFRFPQGFLIDGKRIYLPKIGWAGFFKSRDIEGTPKNVTVSRRGRHWHVSIQAEVEIPTPVHESSSIVGIDLGVKRFATLSDGTVYEPVNIFRKLERKLAGKQRDLSRVVNKKLILAAAVFVLLLLDVSPAFAWGPAVHISTALSILADPGSIIPSMAAAIGCFPKEFIYGSVAADFFIGKSRNKQDCYPHNWKGGFDMLHLGRTKRQKAFATGFLAHLASDTIAHNLYVPLYQSRNESESLRTHVYAEGLADSLVESTKGISAGFILRQVSDCDHLMSQVSGMNLYALIVKRALLLSSVKAWSYLFLGRNNLQSVWPVSFPGTRLNRATKALISLSVKTTKDFLIDPVSSRLTKVDPNGKNKGLFFRKTQVEI